MAQQRFVQVGESVPGAGAARVITRLLRELPGWGVLGLQVAPGAAPDGRWTLTVRAADLPATEPWRSYGAAGGTVMCLQAEPRYLTQGLLMAQRALGSAAGVLIDGMDDCAILRPRCRLLVCGAAGEAWSDAGRAWRQAADLTVADVAGAPALPVPDDGIWYADSRNPDSSFAPLAQWLQQRTQP